MGNSGIIGRGRYPCRFRLFGGGISTISTKPYYDKDQYLRKDGFLDQTTKQEYSFQAVEGKDNTYTISFTDNSTTNNLYYDAANNTLVSIGALSSIDENAEWQLIKIDTDDASEDTPVDLSYLVRGADFNDRGNNRWKGTGPTYSHNNSDAADRCAEFYNKTFDMYQELTDLPLGKYKVTCLGYYRNCGKPETAYTRHNNGTEKLLAELYAGEEKVSLKSIMEGAGKNGNKGTSTTGGYIPNSLSDAESYFANTDSYQNELEVVVKDGTLRIGLRKTVAESSDWTCFDKFRLYYMGKTVDMAKEIYQSAITEAQNTINETTYNGSEKAKLTALISQQVEENVQAYDKATTNVLDATTKLKDAINTYKRYTSQIDEMVTTAKALGIDDADSYQVTITETTTGADLQEKLNAIKVAQYNAVESLKYSEVTAVAGLTFANWSDASSFGHTDYRNVWTDTGKGDNSKAIYYERENGWNDADWEIHPSATVNLPAGKYVVKLACRTSSNATGTVTVSCDGKTLSTASFPTNNAQGLGINKNGAASFDTNDDFANNGDGYGWEWRFLPFNLSQASDVTFTIDEKAVGNHQYPGFTAPDLLTVVKDITLDETGTNPVAESCFANVTLKRSLTADVWNSLVLPFSMTASQVSATFGGGNEDAGTIVAHFTNANNTGDTYQLVFNQQKNNTGKITANEPCIIRPKNGASEYTFTGIRLEAAQSNPTVEHNGISFIGSYDKDGLAITQYDYFLSTDNKMYRAQGGESMKGFRAVFRVSQDIAGEAKNLVVSFDDETTGISTLKTDNAKARTGVYNLSGQLVREDTSLDGLAKGLYIINGKKVVVE